MWLTGECSYEQILPSRTLFLCLVGFYHILPPDQHARSSPAYLPIVSTQQPKLTLSLATQNDLPGRKLFPPIPLGLHLNQAVESSQHIGAEMHLFGTFCYFTNNSASPFWGLACSLGAFPGVLLCAVHMLIVAIKPVLWMMNSCSCSCRQSMGNCKNTWFCLRDPRETWVWNGGGFLLTCTHASMLITYLLD